MNTKLFVLIVTALLLTLSCFGLVAADSAADEVYTMTWAGSTAGAGASSGGDYSSIFVVGQGNGIVSTSNGTYITSTTPWTIIVDKPLFLPMLLSE